MVLNIMDALQSQQVVDTRIQSNFVKQCYVGVFSPVI